MGYNLLIIDDSAVTRKVLRRMIAMTGFDLSEVFEAPDGIEALTILHEQRIDLIFVDINMPRMSGTELVAKLAEDNLLDAIPVIVITSDRNQPRLAELKRRGVRAYINKPFRPEELRDVMAQVFTNPTRDAHGS